MRSSQRAPAALDTDDGCIARRRLCEDKGGDGAHAVELQLGTRSQRAADSGEEQTPLVLRLTPEMLTLLRSELQSARDRIAALPR